LDQAGKSTHRPEPCFGTGAKSEAPESDLLSDAGS
jgi:hypothetical protein